jgi:hypothetical protein
VHPILEYIAECRYLYREVQVIGSDRVQRQAAQFATHTKGSNWKILGQRRKIVRIWALFKGYTGEWEWKAIGDNL